MVGEACLLSNAYYPRKLDYTLYSCCPSASSASSSSAVAAASSASSASSVSLSHFRFRSITLEGMYGFHSNFAELYINIKYRSSSILVIFRQSLAELWSFFDIVFVVCFR